MTEHKVKSESGGWEVTWTCACGEKFTGRSRGARDMTERIKRLAAKNAEIAFRAHLPIR